MPSRLAFWLSDDAERPLFRLAVALTAVAHLAAVALFAKLSLDPANRLWEYGTQAQCAMMFAGDLCRWYWDGQLVEHFASAYMPPLLSYQWLAVFKIFGGDSYAARIAWLAVNWAVSIGAAALMFKLARAWKLSPLAAFLAAAILALYPTHLFVVATYHQTVWAVFFILLLALLLTRAWQAPRISFGLAAALGVVTGFAALNRSEMLIVGAALIFAVCVRSFCVGRRALLPLIVAALATAAALAPWTIRNYVLFDKLIPTAHSVGYNMWKGYTPFTIGSGNMVEVPDSPGDRFAIAVRDAVPRGDAPGARFENRLDAAYMVIFKRDVAEAGVGRLVRLAATKLAMLWGFDWTDRDITARLAYRAPWLLGNILFVWGLALLIRRRAIPAEAALIGGGMLALLTLAYVATAVHTRYRMHLEPLLFIPAAVAVEAMLRRLAARGVPAVTPAGRPAPSNPN